jgi:ATP-dependent Lhr-like helicase
MTTEIARLHPVLAHHVVNTLGWPALRPLQAAAIGPVLDGADCLLLAPTAAGKTEAALFPLLTRMAVEGWDGISVLYVCPLRALLNNLHPRIAECAQWLGRTAAVWHGDTGAAARRTIQRERPDVMLTTPESLEAMLVSTRVDPRSLFAGVRAVVVDEVHAIAGDDRGWHLLHVLERLGRLVGREVQRVGLSATLGNPDELLRWLQGAHTDRARVVVAPPAREGATPEVVLDHVRTIDGAAAVVSTLHRGEKRLVFTDSRRHAEELGAALLDRGVDTHLSHSSLSAIERRRSEEAFAEAQDCVIVATSTLELGVDVGDLDRVIQLGAPRTVASFLQRLGRTGRRPGTGRNCLILALADHDVLQAAGVLLRWSQGWVEPVVPPPSPRHIVAQQLLALALQNGAVGTQTWEQWWAGLGPMAADGAAVLDHLLAEGFLEQDGGWAFIGPAAERRFGRRHFSDLLAVFTAAPQFTVLAGRREIGSVGDHTLLTATDGPRVLLLAGRPWRVTDIDWRRRRCHVEPTDLPGRTRWTGTGTGLSFTVTRGMREVLLGFDPAGVKLSRRASAALADLRNTRVHLATSDGTVVHRAPTGELEWWTWAGTAANRTLNASYRDLVDPTQQVGDAMLRLDRTTDDREALHRLMDGRALTAPDVDEHAVSGLKFSAALPPALARLTVAERLGDGDGAAEVRAEERLLVHS